MNDIGAFMSEPQQETQQEIESPYSVLEIGICSTSS